MVGPFIFFDQMGPAEFLTGQGIDVRPHPHIGLATVTYLFDGEILHRDSLGSEQKIVPGDVNWMTAGRGIVHSERTAPSAGAQRQRCTASRPGSRCPRRTRRRRRRSSITRARRAAGRRGDGVRVRADRGRGLWGGARRSRLSETVLCRRRARGRARCCRSTRPTRTAALYIVEGEIEVAGDRFERRAADGVPAGRRITVRRRRRRAAMLLGGEPLDGPRHIWWNFVASSQERIEQAKADWQRAAVRHSCRATSRSSFRCRKRR